MFRASCSSSGGYSCTNAAYGTVTLIESDSTIRCICTTVSSWRWARGSKHVKEISILWINNNQCTEVGNWYVVNSWCTVRKHQAFFLSLLKFCVVELRQSSACLCETSKLRRLTLIPLTWRIWWAPYKARKWQMALNSAFKRLIDCLSTGWKTFRYT